MKTIVVTGTHAVGKTSLCTCLVQTLSKTMDVKMIPEMARILIAKGISMNDKATEFGIVSYISSYLQFVRNTKAALVISDRSVFDLYAYITLGRSDNVHEEFVRLTEEIVFEEVRRVNAYVYVPIEFSMQVDDVRPADTEYQRAVDVNVQRLLKFFGATVLIASGTVEERVAVVQRWLNV
jgi:predicted ATPase